MGNESWLTRATRIESLWSLGYLIWGAVVAAASAVMSWLSSFNEFIASQGAFGYAAVGLLSALALALTLFLVAAARAKWGGHGKEPQALGEQKNPQTVVGIRETVSLAHFENESVRLDGKRFVKCTFKNCTFIYNGGDHFLEKCTIQESVSITSDYVQMGNIIDLTTQLFRPDLEPTFDGRGRRRNEVKILYQRSLSDQASDSPQRLDIEPKKPQ